MQATYVKRKLWSSLAKIGMEDNFAYEAVYAYSVNYPGAMQSTPGRYRIRITRMPAGEFLKNFTENIDIDQIDASQLNISFTMQAFLEKWVTEGWIPCLDWMGDPDSNEKEIEDDLNEMFEAFTTGMPRNSVEGEFNPFPFKPPKKRKPRKPETTAVPEKMPDYDDDSFDFV